MTVSALLSALLLGVAVGLLGRLVMPGRPAAPVWLTLSVGVGAALLGTITARIVGVDVAGASPLRLTVQTGFAAPAVILAVLAAGRAAPDPGVRNDGAPPAEGLPGSQPVHKAGTEQEGHGADRRTGADDDDTHLRQLRGHRRQPAVSCPTRSGLARSDHGLERFTLRHRTAPLPALHPVAGAEGSPLGIDDLDLARDRAGRRGAPVGADALRATRDRAVERDGRMALDLGGIDRSPPPTSRCWSRPGKEARQRGVVL